jgi:hypothetical protein
MLNREIAKIRIKSYERIKQSLDKENGKLRNILKDVKDYEK